MSFKSIGVTSGLTLALLTGLTGCGGVDTVKEKIDPPKVVYQKEATDQVKQAADAVGKISTQLFLVDKYGYVVPTTVMLPETSSVAKQALEYLVQDGPVTEYLPNGFQAVLPAETVVKSMDVQNGVATVDFSEAFTHYDAKNEKKILQSIVWTLTQFDSVKEVALKVEGSPINEMPVDKTQLNGHLTRDVGINIEGTQLADVMNSHQVTLYFIKSENKVDYLVPVTRRVSNAETNSVATIVQELVNGPKSGSNLSSEFMADVALIDQPVIENGVASLNFNANVLSLDGDKKTISSELMDALVLSLTEQTGVSSVAVTVDGSKEILDGSGNPLTAPVTRPAKVNTGSY